MIVSRKSAEGFLGKKLEGLGGGKRSYYVLSSDGTKNLGGPHTKDAAKQRLRQVEYFKRNPPKRKRNPIKENTRFGRGDIRYERRFISLDHSLRRELPSGFEHIPSGPRFTPHNIDELLSVLRGSTQRASTSGEAKLRKRIIAHVNQQDVDWPWDDHQWDSDWPWSISGLFMVRRDNPVSIIYEIFGDPGLRAIEDDPMLRKLLNAHPKKPEVAAAIGMDWMLSRGLEPQSGDIAEEALRRLRGIKNPGKVIPIGRAVGFEHYGEPALPKAEAKRRSERRRKGGFIHEGIPARPLTAEERKKIARLEGNPRPFLKREHDWNEVLIDRAGKKLTRKQIRDYYKRVEKRIWPYLEGQTVMVIFAPKRNEFILRRKRDGDDRYIKLTKLKGIDDQNSLEYWVNRRAIEFHVVLTTKTAPILWLDLDMHKTRDKAARAGLLRKMKKAARRIKKVFRQMGVNRIFVYESGQDGGLHFEGDLPKRRGVDALRKALTKALDKEFEGDEVFTTGPAKSGQIRLDTTTFHHLGSLRAPYSMTIRGTPKKRITT